MDHYVDINLRHDPELPAFQILNVVFEKIHLTLADLNMTSVGISFPEEDLKRKNLGTCCRMHGSMENLSTVLKSSGLERVLDHILIGTVNAVPLEKRFRKVSRVQVKSSPERLRRRLMRRHDLSPEEALLKIPDSVAQTSELPFLTMRSRSTGQSFRLFLKQGPIEQQEMRGSFNTYGLSSEATIPWF